MQINRFLGFDGAISPTFQPTVGTPGLGFMAWPLLSAPGCSGAAAVLDLYRLAYEQARAAALPSWYERLTVACAN